MALSNLKNFTRRAIGESLFKISITPAAMQAAYDKAIAAVTPLVRSFLVSNYAAKGMGTHAKRVTTPTTYKHGSIQRACSQAIVSLNRRGDGITVSFPRGLDNETYLIGNSLNYGWTRGKNRNTGQKQIAGALGATGSNRRARRGKKYGKGVAGFNFFELTSQQEEEVGRRFVDVFEQELGRQLNNVTGRAA